jgi:hypothetical protein
MGTPSYSRLAEKRVRILYLSEESQSQSYFASGGLPPIGSLGAKALEPHDQYFFQLNTCGYSPYVTSSLTRGWVCRLQFMLVLASSVILGSKSRGPHDHILLSQIRDSPAWKTRSPCLYTPGTGWPSYTSRHWDPVSSPPTTRRATMEIFEPASNGFFLCGLCADSVKSRLPKIPVFAWLFATAITCLLRRFLAMDIFSRSAIPAFIHVTIC